MTRHTTPAAGRGAVDAVKAILMASRRPLTSQEIADLLGGEYTRAQVTRAAANLCRYGGFRRSTVVQENRQQVAYMRPSSIVTVPEKPTFSRPRSMCALQEVWG